MKRVESVEAICQQKRKPGNQSVSPKKKETNINLRKKAMEDDRKNIVAPSENWSETVEDLVSAGDTAAAISLLESVVEGLQVSPELDRQLASALEDLAGLYSSAGFSLKADELHSRASLIRHRLLYTPPRLGSGAPNDGTKEEKPDSSARNFNKSSELASPGNEDPDDDWEAIADRSPDKLISPECLPGVSKLSLEDTKPKGPKRRGRGTFSYGKQEMFSDHLTGSSGCDNIRNEDAHDGSEKKKEIGHSTYGTRHALVLANFPPSTKTIDLEKLFMDFRDSGVVIRWINDTTALAVFGSPSNALEAMNRVTFPFTVTVLDENDDLLSSIPPKDLEPPRQRPKTSARTAQRLIAQGMGLKLKPTSFGSKEMKKQEDERRSRIVSRQKLKDDAWGSDD